MLSSPSVSFGSKVLHSWGMWYLRRGYELIQRKLKQWKNGQGQHQLQRLEALWV
ncbi:Uncharacterized protein TCM_013745 [Theobroma cacao]|uniref:Uncharacterized protein n=1 Tax=Theobroma cacao TaxID=3641 RepID=A0A061FWR4_THECC|nr:Uncharacterized protein TCM_013745 [Theobroma cacao]